MTARVDRNKETGEFSCVVGSKTLLKAKIASGIKRVHDMVDEINKGYGPKLTWDGTAESRRFMVQVGDFVVFSGEGALKAYKELDKLEAALLPQHSSHNLGTIASSEMPAVPVPEMGGVHAASAPHDFEDQQ